MRRTKLLTSGILAVFVIMWFGCGTSYTLRVVDKQAKEIYLTFPKDAHVKVGDVFVVYKPQQQQSSVRHGGHGGHDGGSASQPTRRPVSYVKVTHIIDETHAIVSILSGQVADGLQAEKLK